MTCECHLKRHDKAIHMQKNALNSILDLELQTTHLKDLLPRLTPLIEWVLTLTPPEKR